MKSRIVTVSVVAAIVVACLSVGSIFAQQDGNDRAALIKDAAAKATPRAADGHPDLTGYWADRIELGFGYNIPVTKSADGKTVVYHDADAPELDARAQPRFKARAADSSQRPQYKPQFVAKQRELASRRRLVRVPGGGCVAAEGFDDAPQVRRDGMTARDECRRRKRRTECAWFGFVCHRLSLTSPTSAAVEPSSGRRG